MIFDIMSGIVKSRCKTLSRSGTRVGYLKLRMVVATWDLEASRYVDSAELWQSIRSVAVKSKHKPSKLNIELEITASIASAHIGALQKCFKSWTLLRDDAKPIVLDEAWFSPRAED